MATPGNNTPATSGNGTARRSGPRGTAAQAAMLAVLAALIAVALAAIASYTRERVARNEQAWIRQHLDVLIDPRSHDNDLLADRIEVVSPELLGTPRPVAIYRATRGGAPVAAAIAAVAPDGYRGPIELLVAVAHDGTLLGVQVLRHDETPGLGDAFEQREPHWLERFRGLSLSNPPPPRWTVRKDGGAFDAFTGATITPRAIVKAVRRALEYYQINRERIFRAPDRGARNASSPTWQ